MILHTVLTKPLKARAGCQTAPKHQLLWNQWPNDLDRIENMIFYIFGCSIKITSMKDVETDYISVSKDAYISFLITFVFIKIMKVLCKILENLFRALTTGNVD